MDFNVGNVSRAFKVYQNQSRIADLNRQSNLRTAQVQTDRVSLSTEAMRLFAESRTRPEPKVVLRNLQPAVTARPPFRAETPTVAPVTPQAVPKAGPAPTTGRAPSISPRSQTGSADKIPDLDLLDLLNLANAQDLDDTNKDAENPASRRGRRGPRA